jgi:transposase
MRRSFDGLGLMTEQIVGEDPLSGHLFVFINKRQDRTKILYWDDDGYALWYKRLEEGTFQLPADASGRVEVTASDLSLLLDGIDITQVRRRKRYRRKTNS